MEEHTLKGEYISILKDGRLSYGGSQRWSDSPILRGYGCGVIAALDLLLYLARQREVGSAQSTLAGGPVPWTLYDRWARQLSRRYMPVVPPVGTNGWAIALGLNAVFLRQGIPLRASWGGQPGPAVDPDGRAAGPGRAGDPVHRQEFSPGVAERGNRLLHAGPGKRPSGLLHQRPLRHRHRHG